MMNGEQSEDKLMHGRDEVIQLQQQIRRIIDQIKEIDAATVKSSSVPH